MKKTTIRRMLSGLFAAGILVMSIPSAFAVGPADAIGDTDEKYSVAVATADPTVTKICYSGLGVCTGNGVRVRSGPGTEYRILGHYNKGDSLDMYSVRVSPTPANSDWWADWLYVSGYSSYDEKRNEGFISEQYYTDTDVASLNLAEVA